MVTSDITADDLFAKIGRLQLQVERRDALILMQSEKIKELLDERERYEKPCDDCDGDNCEPTAEEASP